MTLRDDREFHFCAALYPSMNRQGLAPSPEVHQLQICLQLQIRLHVYVYVCVNLARDLKSDWKISCLEPSLERHAMEDIEERLVCIGVAPLDVVGIKYYTGRVSWQRARSE